MFKNLDNDYVYELGIGIVKKSDLKDFKNECKKIQKLKCNEFSKNTAMALLILSLHLKSLDSVPDCFDLELKENILKD